MQDDHEEWGAAVPVHELNVVGYFCVWPSSLENRVMPVPYCLYMNGDWLGEKGRHHSKWRSGLHGSSMRDPRIGSEQQGYYYSGDKGDGKTMGCIRVRSRQRYEWWRAR